MCDYLTFDEKKQFLNACRNKSEYLQHLTCQYEQLGNNEVAISSPSFDNLGVAKGKPNYHLEVTFDKRSELKELIVATTATLRNWRVIIINAVASSSALDTVSSDLIVSYYLDDLSLQQVYPYFSYSYLYHKLICGIKALQIKKEIF